MHCPPESINSLPNKAANSSAYFVIRHLYFTLVSLLRQFGEGLAGIDKRAQREAMRGGVTLPR